MEAVRSSETSVSHRTERNHISDGLASTMTTSNPNWCNSRGTNLVYADPVDNEEEHRIVDACQTIRNYPGVIERMRRPMMRRVEPCTE
jgi:hypothetical protein